MAELPEVETLRRELERDIGGKRIKSVDVPGNGAIPRHSTKKQFIALLEGTKVTGMARRDLLLLLKLDSGDLLVIGLEHGGQLRRNAIKDELAKGTRVVITFSQGGQLRLIDDVGGLELFVVPADKLAEEVPALQELGHRPARRADLLDEVRRDGPAAPHQAAAAAARPHARRRHRPVYADEILHAAGLRHDRETSSLTTQEIRRLYRSLVETIHEAASTAASRWPTGATST